MQMSKSPIISGYATNQKQELPVATMFVNESDKMSNRYKRPSNDAPYQVSIQLAKRF
jgi:hypothetical protein